MDIKQIKRVVLGGGVVGALPLVILFFISIACYQGTTCPHLPNFFLKIINVIEYTVADNLIFSLIFLAPIFLLLSLITYRLKDEVFTAWWSFACWWVPVIIITTIYFETAGGGGGGWGMSSGMDEFLVLSLLYIIFIITSLVKIVRAYTRAKQGVADKQGTLKELEQKVTIGDSKIEGHYDVKKNTTTIKKKLKEKHDDERETKEVFDGLRILKIITEKGSVKVNY